MSDFLEREMIAEFWGEDFLPLSENPRVKFGADSIFVELKKPVKNMDGEEVKTVEFKEPTVATLKSIDSVKGEVAKGAALLCACTGIPNAAFNNVLASDFMLLSKVVTVFLSDGQETGRT